MKSAIDSPCLFALPLKMHLCTVAISFGLWCSDISRHQGDDFIESFKRDLFKKWTLL